MLRLRTNGPRAGVQNHRRVLGLAPRRAALTATCKGLRALCTSAPHLWEDLRLSVRVDLLPSLALWLAARAASLRALALSVLPQGRTPPPIGSVDSFHHPTEAVLQLRSALDGG